jgi:PhnB protein
MRIPAGFAEVTPYIFVEGAERYAEFLKGAFDCEELGRSTAPDGSIANCQLRFRHATIMITEASERFPASSAAFYLYVEDADASTLRATQAGAELVMGVDDMPYGDRQGGVRDPAGNLWWISQRLVDTGYF